MNFYNYTSLRYSLVFFLLASVNILFAQSSTNVTGPNFKFVNNKLVDGTRTTFRNFSNSGYLTSSSYHLNRFPRPYNMQRWERT